MPPKPNKQREKLEQNRSSSRARAQQSLVASLNQNDNISFIGFGSFATTNTDTTKHTIIPFTNFVYDNSDPDIAMAWKSVSKKGIVTKSKGLSTLLQEILPNKPLPALRSLLGPFVHQYNCDIRDQNDRKVRKLWNEILLLFTMRLKPKPFILVLPKLIPYWLIAMNDLNADVAKIAKQAWETLFPECNDRNAILCEHFSLIISELKSYFVQTVNNFEGIPLSPDDQEERYERVVTASILSINSLILVGKSMEIEKAEETDGNITNAIATLVTSEAFIRLVTLTSKHPAFTRDGVRKASYQTLQLLCEHLPSTVLAKQEFFGRLILGTLTEKCSSNHEEMWNAILTFLHVCPHVWESSKSFVNFVQNAIVPRLQAQIRHGFYGSAQKSFPHLLPFLSCIPFQPFMTSGSTLYVNIIEQCWKFIESGENKQQSVRYEAMNAMFECMTASFSVFLTSELNLNSVTSYLAHRENDSSNDSEVVEKYTDQFQPLFEKILLSMLCSDQFPASIIKTFVSNLLKMTSRLRLFKAPGIPYQEIIMNLQAKFLQKIQMWLRKVILLVVSLTEHSNDVPTFQSYNVLVFLQEGWSVPQANDCTFENNEWLKTSCLVYRQLVSDMTHMIDEHTLQSNTNEVELANTTCLKVYPLAELIAGYLETVGLNKLLEPEEDIETHFERYFTHALETIAGWEREFKPQQCNELIHLLLRASRFIAVISQDPINMIRRLCQCIGVIKGCDPTLLHMICCETINFQLSIDAVEAWFSCGKSDFENLYLDTNTMNPITKTMCSLWHVKFFDSYALEYVNAITRNTVEEKEQDYKLETLLSAFRACLGCENSAIPVISLDTVVGMCQIASNENSTSSEIFVELSKSLLEVILSLRNTATALTIPDELLRGELKILHRLFMLASNPDNAKAHGLWGELGTKRFAQITEQCFTIFIDNVSQEIHKIIASNDESFSLKYWGSCVKNLFQLSSTCPHFNAQNLTESIDLFNILNSDSTLYYQPCQYNRLLLCLEELSFDEGIRELLQDYLAMDEHKELLHAVIDLDVCHSLTCFIVESDTSTSVRHSWETSIQLISQSLTLGNLYTSTSLQKAIDSILINCVQSLMNQQTQLKFDHRLYVFQNQIATHILPTKYNDSDHLDRNQQNDLDAIVTMSMCKLASLHSKVEILQRWESQDIFSQKSYIYSFAIASLIQDCIQVGESSITPNIKSSMATIFGKAESLVTTVSDDTAILYFFADVWRNLPTFTASSSVSLLLTFGKHIYFLRKAINVFVGTSNVANTASVAVPVEEWIAFAEYFCYMPNWLRKQLDVESSGIFHKAVYATTQYILDNTKNLDNPDASIKSITGYPKLLVRGQVALLRLIRFCHDELTSESLRQPLCVSVLKCLATVLHLKSNILSTYVGLTSPRESYAVVDLSLSIEDLLAETIHCLPVVLESYATRKENLRELVLDVFGGRGPLCVYFGTAKRDAIHVNTGIQTLMYTLITHSHVLRPPTSQMIEDVDLNADDEAATEVALAKLVIPKELRTSLKHAFGSREDVSYITQLVLSSENEKSNAVMLTKMMLWDMFLCLFPMRSDGTNATSSSIMVASALSSFAGHRELMMNCLTMCATVLSQQPSGTDHSSCLINTPLFDLEDLANGSTLNPQMLSLPQLASRLLFRTVIRAPSMVRVWWNDYCSRTLRSWATKYFEDYISPIILKSELDIIRTAAEVHAWDEDEIRVKGSKISREIITTYVKDDCALEMIIRVPTTYPLRTVEVECTKKIGITEDRWRRWILQIIKVTSSQDGSLLDAVLLWKNNLDKEFEGVDPCPICYSILHPKTLGLPALPCKTCKNKYHNTCLYKWFRQSGKNKCPICQQPF